MASSYDMYKKFIDTMTSDALFKYEFDVTEGIINSPIVINGETNLSSIMGFYPPFSFNEMVETISTWGLSAYNDGAIENLTSNDLLKKFEAGQTKHEMILYCQQPESYTQMCYYMTRNEEDGHVWAFVVAKDVTEIKKVENSFSKELEQFKKEKTALLEKEEKAKETQKLNQETILSLNISLNERMSIIQNMSQIYYIAYLIDLENDFYKEITADEKIRNVIGLSGHNCQRTLDYMWNHMVVREKSVGLKEFNNLSTINERLKNTNLITFDYMGVYSGWSQEHFISGERNEDGSLKNVIFAARTIHDEKKREEDSKKQIQNYVDIISNAGLGVWNITLKENEAPRLNANEKMKELLGIEDQNLTEEEAYINWYSRIVESDLPSVLASVQEMIQGRFSENTYQWIHPKKGIIYARCGGTARIMEDGTVMLSGYHGDVTDAALKEKQSNQELHEAKEAAEAASAAKTTFLNNMSHDIRTPMNAILGFSELMEKHVNEPEVISDYLHKTKDSTKYLLSIINNVLDLARIDSGRESVDIELVDLERDVENLQSIFAVDIAKKSLNIIWEQFIQHRYVLMDLPKVRQILVNILSNSMKYTPNGGTVRFVCNEIPTDRLGYSNYEVVISDSGIGMSKEYKEQIFEAFSRERNTTESKVIGTGLGMAIVKRLVDLMGASIEVDSELGKGTSFKVVFTLMTVEDPEDLISENTAPFKALDFSGKRILLAEDNDLNAEIASTLLQDAGFMVERAEDGVECIDMLNKMNASYYDVILMDIQMPNLNGYDATKRIRLLKDEAKANIPILAVTANAFEEDRKMALEAGMNGHVAKPLNIEELIKALSNLLN